MISKSDFKTGSKGSKYWCRSGAWQSLGTFPSQEFPFGFNGITFFLVQGQKNALSLLRLEPRSAR